MLCSYTYLPGCKIYGTSAAGFHDSSRLLRLSNVRSVTIRGCTITKDVEIAFENVGRKDRWALYGRENTRWRTTVAGKRWVAQVNPIYILYILSLMRLTSLTSWVTLNIRHAIRESRGDLLYCRLMYERVLFYRHWKQCLYEWIYIYNTYIYTSLMADNSKYKTSPSFFRS